MGTKVTKKLFERVTSEEATRLFSSLGFVEAEPGAFRRECGEVSHGFGFTPNPSFTHFHIPVGVDVPALVARTDYIDFAGEHYATLIVSRWLGELKPSYTRSDIYYHFATVEEMRGTFPQVYDDFVEQAEPWLAGLTTIESVAKEFYKWRIGPPSMTNPSSRDPSTGNTRGWLSGLFGSYTGPQSTGDTRRPDPFAWAIYGWLLQEAGQKDDARPWLLKAYDFLQQPEHMKAGRLVPRGTPGSRPIPRRAEEDRLSELLRKDVETE